MKRKERTFFANTSNFLEPTIKQPLVTLRAFIVYWLWALVPVVHIVFIKKIVELIEKWDKNEFVDFIIYYAILIVVFEGLLFLVRKWWWVESVNAFRKIIHHKYVKKFFTLWNNETERLWTWKLISLIDRWMDKWALLLDVLIHNFIKVFITFSFTFYMIVSENISYWILFLIIYVLLHIIWWYINQFTLKYRRDRESTWHIYTKQLVKIIMNKFEILQTSKWDREIKNLDKTTSELKNFNLQMSPYIHLFFRLPEWFLTWSKFFILFFLWLQIIEWEASMATFVWLFWILTLMDSVITSSMIFFKDFTKEFSTVEKMWDFFDNTKKIKWYDKWKKFKHTKWKIEIQNLTYWYIKNKPVFKDFNLKLAWEKVTAIVWNSGSWKTTLVKLISGYIKASSGDIIIDKQSLNKVSLKSYYKDIWYLTQEPSVFDGSVLDNLTYAIDRELKKWEVEKILKLAKCEFIYDLADWLETEIWERWVRLSWWQRQRLAIAKIFLKDPKIILLDEPTSALDSFSEELITKAMHNLFKWRTIIIIAHRLQTVKNADDIILLANWKIIERWNHAELVKQKWVYKKMLDLQSGF